MADYIHKDYQILCYIEPDIREIENVPYMENIVEGIIAGGHNILIVIDDVHNKNKSAIFSLIKTLQSLERSKKEKVSFLLSARQPEFDLAMDRGLFDTNIIQTINSIFDNTKKFKVPYFTKDEIVGFIEKYKDNVHISKRNKNITDFAHEIIEDTKGHPIMVRFSLLQDGLRTHVEKMYAEYLVENNFPNTERIKSVIACSLYDISSIAMTEDMLYNKLDLKKSSLQIINTIIKRNGNVWTTIHPRWDFELFKYMFSLNEEDREEIKETFGCMLTKILDIQKGTSNQLNLLSIIYNTIAVEKFIDIKTIQEMINEDHVKKN